MLFQHLCSNLHNQYALHLMRRSLVHLVRPVGFERIALVDLFLDLELKPRGLGTD
jgi:hypothetical protein